MLYLKSYFKWLLKDFNPKEFSISNLILMSIIYGGISVTSIIDSYFKGILLFLLKFNLSFLIKKVIEHVFPDIKKEIRLRYIIPLMFIITFTISYFVKVHLN